MRYVTKTEATRITYDGVLPRKASTVLGQYGVKVGAVKVGCVTRYTVSGYACDGSDVAATLACEAMNLDCMSTDELRDVIPTLRADDPRRTYARYTILARFSRENGDIDEALALEAKCERLYQRLPAELQW